MSSPILIIGGGHAGAQAVDTLRREGYNGRIVLISDEPYVPYQRPPLSKQFLAAEWDVERLSFRHQSYYDEHRVELRLNSRAVHIDAADRVVMLSNGEEIHYSSLLLCLGACSRQLTCPGAKLSGIHYLRNIADARGIKDRLRHGARVVIIGGGYIGLETAATARKAGCAVTVLEMADRVMNRVVAANVSAYFEREHRRQGVDLVCNARVLRVEGAGHVERVICAAGGIHEADIVIVGIGATANMQLAMDAGLECENGIVVDEYCRTSDPAIYAAGDCTYHPSIHFETRVRLESVDNAFEQAKAAALNILGKPAIHDSVPWFWSDQFDNKLLIVGLSQGHDLQVIRGDPGTRSFSVCYLKRGELVAVEAVNHSRDYMAARRLIVERARPILARLQDPGTPLKAIT
jgi:3-phenylpropionate/trans-cinnamate dioxygenase ferredoxin reductase subunit